MPGLVRDLLTYAIENKRRKKAIEAFLAQFPEQQPFAGKKVSELAAVLGGVGQAMPIPEHMGGNALPFSMSPTLSPGQRQQLTPPSVITPQNAQLAKAKALIRSGLPEGEKLGLEMLVPPPEDKGSWQSAGNGWLYNTATQAIMQIPGYEGVRSPVSVGQGAVLVDPTTGKVILDNRGKDAKNLIVRERSISVEGKGGRTETQGLYDVIDMDELKLVGTLTPEGTSWKEPTRGGSVRITGPNGELIEFGDLAPTTGAQTEAWRKVNEQKLLLTQYSTIDELMRPEFLTLKGKAQYLGSDIALFLGGEGLLKTLGGDPKRQYTQDQFYAASHRAANDYIRSVTGAQMSEYEIGRLLGAIPNPKDNPVEFQAKLDYAKYIARVTLKTYEDALTAGKGEVAAKAEAITEFNKLYPEGSDFGKYANAYRVQKGWGAE